MSRTKQKSEFVSGLGSAFEFVKAISDEVRKLGGNDDDLRKVIAQANLRRQIATAIMGNSKTARKPLVNTSTPVIANLIPKCWSVIKDVVQSSFSISQLKFRSFLNDGDGASIDGQTMRQRAVSMKGNVGLADAKYFLDNPAEIPADLQGKYLVFPGTLLRDSDGILLVPCLVWDGGRWSLSFVWLGCDWDDGGRFACSE